MLVSNLSSHPLLPINVCIFLLQAISLFHIQWVARCHTDSCCLAVLPQSVLVVHLLVCTYTQVTISEQCSAFSLLCQIFTKDLPGGHRCELRDNCSQKGGGPGSLSYLLHAAFLCALSILMLNPGCTTSVLCCITVGTILTYGVVGLTDPCSRWATQLHGHSVSYDQILHFSHSPVT